MSLFAESVCSFAEIYIYLRNSYVYLRITLFYLQIPFFICNHQVTTSNSGVKAVNQDDKALYHKAFGNKNRTEALPNNASIRFGIASGCKLFTAIAAVQLVQDGKLSLDRKLHDLLDFSFPSSNENITKLHVMCYDLCVSFHPAYYPKKKVSITVASNKSTGAFTVMKELEKQLKLQ